MALEDLSMVIMSVIIGTLAAIVYSLRVLILMERRVAKIEMHIEKMASTIMQEEYKIEKKFGAKKSKKKK